MTSAIQEKRLMTAEDYLKMERNGLREKIGKHEFFNQKLIFMPGASNNHNIITKNVIYALEHQVRQNRTNHLVYAQDMRTISHIPNKNYFYPDVEIVEGRAIFDDEHKDILVNPSLIIEVLSESTEKFDRGDKFKSYRNIHTFTEYILISQDGKNIEQFYKNDNGKWEIGEVVSEGTLKLKTLPFELDVEDVYLNAEFLPPSVPTT
jgi:Uma2 family endonuclease